VLELVRFGFRKLWEGRSFIVRVAVAGNDFRPESRLFFEKMWLDAT
jgi:hypothetical protein